ncbi:MAG: hypothetical protein PF693_04725 [Spirochaetia bacterium]|jgi:hypothetical protein|nr:hypothetical protein [Spirochaetia bacterium]
MFWKNNLHLGTLPIATKIIVTFFLILIGIGYLLGFANIFMTYSPVDGKPGLSLEDVSMSFYGSTSKTALEKAVDGSMKQYFNSDGDYQVVKDWVQDGATEKVWDSEVKPIFDVSCSTCHSEEAAVAGVVTVDYSDVEEFLGKDTGKSWSRLVGTAHTHLLAIAPLVFLLILILSFTSYPAVLKNVISIFALSAVFLDIASWFLAKFAPLLGIFVLVGGMSLGLSFGLLVLLPLYDIWIKKV